MEPVTLAELRGFYVLCDGSAIGCNQIGKHVHEATPPFRRPLVKVRVTEGETFPLGEPEFPT